MVQTLTGYLADAFSGQLNNALFISVIYALLVDDLRKQFEDWLLKLFKIKSFFWKMIIKLLSFIPALVFGLIALFLVVFFLWLISFFL